MLFLKTLHTLDTGNRFQVETEQEASSLWASFQRATSIIKKKKKHYSFEIPAAFKTSY